MESEQTPPSNLYKHAATFGAIIGAVSIVLTVVFYVVSLSILASFKFLLIMVVIGLGIVIYAGINYRTEVGGFLPYGKAFLHGFIALAVSGLIGTFFNMVLYHVVDPELPVKLTDAVIENTEEMMRNFGAPDGSIDEAMDNLRTDMPQQFSVGGLALGYCKALIGYAVIALITALFVRKNEPVEM